MRCNSCSHSQTHCLVTNTATFRKPGFQSHIFNKLHNISCRSKLRKALCGNASIREELKLIEELKWNRFREVLDGDREEPQVQQQIKTLNSCHRRFSSSVCGAYSQLHSSQGSWRRSLDRSCEPCTSAPTEASRRDAAEDRNRPVSYHHSVKALN